MDSRDTTDATDATDTRRRRDPEATRTAILDAAEELFVDAGPSDTTTSEIARRAGVTKSLIHPHFGSKEELWVEVKRRRFQRYYDEQKAMLTSPEGSEVEILRRSVAAYFRFLRDDPAAVRFMSWRFVEADDPCLALEEELFALGVERLAKAQKRGELRADVEPLSMIKAFLAMCLHWFQTKPFLCQMHERLLVSDESLEDLDERYLEDIQRIFLEGIVPR